MKIDYRKDIIELMQATGDDLQSLNQSMIALKIISKIYNQAVLGNPPHGEEKRELKAEKNEIATNSKNDEKSVDNVENEHEEKVPAKEKAKETAAKALSPTVLKNKNKYAAVTPLPKPMVKKIIPVAEPEEKQYQIRRKLLGSEAVDENGHSVQYFNEHLTRIEKLENGDTVTLLDHLNDSGNRPIIKVEHHPEPFAPGEEIIEFGPAVIHKDSFGLYIKKDSNGKSLGQVNPEKAILYLDLNTISHFNLHENDLISVVWRASDPSFIRIRWRYAEEEVTIPEKETVNKTKSPVKHKTKGKHKSLLHQLEKKEKQSTEKQSEEYTSRIDFDLDKKRVTVVVGDKSLTSNLAKVIEAHNGVARIIEMKQASNVLRACKESNYVILIQSYIKHSISQILINSPHKSYSIAMATTAGQLAVEKALYRARYKLNVTDNDQIQYPFLVND
ncbi:hypothetical protein [uncultured Lactobacillus sp.]|uniref:hypothetical protein n=1 Tax=uncultured Lactobacillus sp. TaxID=153152 RepID=UPI0026302F61|nr:hypothetical protein [uncultured Lactobacillus sp.]